MNNKLFLLITVGIFILGCQSENDVEKPIPQWSQEASINMNSTFSQEETEAIEAYLSRRPDWKMKETGTGLQYFIYEKTEGIKPQVGDIVWVNFSVSLLNNKICYTSKRGDPESFMIEKSDIESGIHEGVQLMSEGEKAKFILPSHIAHGLIGDLDQIPPLETVIYDIELLKIDRPYE
ncbi:MAG: FKBP-type peptidyl-prolyl cis-trans isomerase [Putridiphycobacter sp.]|jgi:FKBP-type peptidyl-prolyl cis-trans isomerase|nr:FKBP-type peptidyl-prolyl cis-trans isomerase [Putridiphycobacter sp.]